MFNIIKLNAKDNIAVAPMNIPLGSKINSDLNAENEIPFGHKISLNNIKKGELIYKYGQIIGIAIDEIKKGAKGADCIQTINHKGQNNLAQIYFESKDHKTFKEEWVAKLLGDMKEKNKVKLAWYLKWFASVCLVLGMSFRASGVPELAIFDLTFSFVGIIGWLGVSLLWEDRALILLNGVGFIILFSGLIKYFFVV